MASTISRIKGNEHEEWEDGQMEDGQQPEEEEAPLLGKANHNMVAAAKKCKNWRKWHYLIIYIIN